MSDNSIKTGRAFFIQENTPQKIIDSVRNSGIPRDYIMIQNHSNVNVYISFLKPTTEFFESAGIPGVYSSPSGGDIKIPPNSMYEEFPESIHKGEFWMTARSAPSGSGIEEMPLLTVFINGVR